MAVFLPGKLLYLAHHGVASWATTEALRSLGGQYVDIGLDHTAIGASHHASFDDVRRHIAYDGEIVVSTVRSHYDVWLSEWWRQSPTEPLVDYLTRVHGGDRLPFRRWQRTPGVLFWHVAPSKLLLRYETLAEDWRQLTDRLDLPPTPLPKKNVSTGRNTNPHDRESIAFIDEVYGEEIAALGYAGTAPPSRSIRRSR